MEKWNCWLKESKLWATFLDFHYAKRLWRVTRNHKDMKLTDISLTETCPLSQLCLCTENPSLPTYLSMWNEKSDSYSNGVFHVWAFISEDFSISSLNWAEFSLLQPVRKMDSQQGRAKQNLLWNKCNFSFFHRPTTPVLPWYCYSDAWGQRPFSLVFYFCLTHFIAFACLCICNSRNMVFSCCHVLFCKLLEIFRYVLGNKWQMSYKTCFEKVL